MKRVFHYLKNLKFRTKLILVYLLVSIIPVIVLGVYSYNQANIFLQKQAEENLRESVKQIGDNINFRCTQYESVINSILFNFKFKQLFSGNEKDGNNSILSDYVDPFFNNILFLYKDVLDVSIFTSNKKILRGQYIIPIELAEGFDWYSDVLKTPNLLWASKNGKLICAQLFAIDKNIDQKVNHNVLFLNIDTESLFKGLENVKLDSYGIMIVNQDNYNVYNKIKNIKEPVDKDFLEIQKQTIGDFKYENMTFFHDELVLDKPGWKLYFYAPTDQISPDVKSIAAVTIGIIIACVIGLAFIIWIISETFVRRINSLNKKMKIAEDGNLKIIVESNSRDEIGELTNRFGKMLSNTNRLIEEVYHSNLVLKETELKALQAQINPHFLYNTFSIINWKAYQINAMDICNLTNTISKFYRTVLNKGNNVISIEKELENAKAYIEIQLIMHDHNFDFNCEIDEEILHYNMINMVFQPILENAIEHGIDKKREGRGIIQVRGYFDEEKILFSVRDNGPGMGNDLVKEVISKSSHGYGLKNVQERIQIYFGEEYGLTVKSELGTGTEICIAIPKFDKKEFGIQ